MTLKHIGIALLLLSGGSLQAAAQERVDHFSGKPAKTLTEAIAHFSAGNTALRELLTGEVSAEDLAKIHQLSYTLENALGKLNDEMKTLAVLLEQIHLGSETGNAQAVQGNGSAYFTIVDAIELGKN